MIQVLFVSSNPPIKHSKTKKSSIDYRSEKVLDSWVSELGIKFAIKININGSNSLNGDVKPQELEYLSRKISPYLNKVKIIALGQLAEKYLLALDIKDFFSLPYPSLGRKELKGGRITNDELAKCRDWIKQHTYT